MGLRKPTQDAYRVRVASAHAADFKLSAYSFCCWATFDSFQDTATLWRNFNSTHSGCIMRLRDGVGVGDDLQMNYIGTAGNHTATIAGHGISTGTWAFWFFAVDDSGNWLFGVDDTSSTGTDSAPKTSGNDPNQLTLLHADAGTAGHGALATMAGFRGYDRALTSTEFAEIRHSSGRDAIVSGRICHLPLMDAAPGVDTGTRVPMDAATPGRLWEVVGTGDAYTWEPAPYPLRRAS
jgi:hypothetical protein